MGQTLQRERRATDSDGMWPTFFLSPVKSQDYFHSKKERFHTASTLESLLNPASRAHQLEAPRAHQTRTSPNHMSSHHEKATEKKPTLDETRIKARSRSSSVTRSSSAMVPSWRVRRRTASSRRARAALRVHTTLK